MVCWKKRIRGLVLASTSPRRKEILSGMHIDFSVEVADIGEESRFFEKTNFKNAIKKLAREKGKIISEKYPDAPVLSADTIVVLGSKVLGKPQNADDAKITLKTLSGKKHQVYTAVSLSCKNAGFNETVLEKTDVRFRDIDDEELEEYLKSAVFLDKAGSYGIQEEGGFFVEKINGDYSNVVGLPVCATIKLLKKYQVSIK